MAIKPWATNYPAALDTVANQPILVNLDDKSDVSHPNSLGEAVRALEVKVGSDSLETGSLRAVVATNTANIATNTADIATHTTALTGLLSVQDNVEAFSGGGQGSATPISAAFVRVSLSAAHLDSVLLPIPSVGREVEVRNDSTYDVAVYPQSNGQIDALGTDVYYILASGSVQKFVATDTNQWYTKNKGQRYIDLGDSAVALITQASMTMDNAYHDLDASASIPPSSRGKASRFRLVVADATDGALIRIRQNGLTTEFGVLQAVHAGTSTGKFDDMLGDILTDSGGIIEYKANEALTTCTIYLCGYWVEG